MNHLDFDIMSLEIIRGNILKAIEPLDRDALNFIPKGFKNSIFWNAAHVLATQQLLVYANSNEAPIIDQTIIDRYKKGTAPTLDYASTEEIAVVKELLPQIPALTKKDYENGKFKGYNAYKTSFGTPLNTVEEAIRFNNYHEGLHFGYILALKHTL
ncbi:MAG: hypothetical protein CL843_15505 [Crocinitomicaceae bacterium]|nr:hypothetical protein [Crocinitomicaceae bacterium]|tara:strand:- start:9169 stop:9636 length:468 start_codon:yes stop_codon:yes gene_type:complete